MERFEEILIKYEFPTRTGQPQTTIEELERAIKFNLPNDYKFFLVNYNGFENFIGKEYVRFWDIDELLEMNKGYLIFENLPMTLGIGGNGAGEFIAIEKTEQNNSRVVLSPFIDTNKINHIEIGKSFSDFLIRLENGKEWFENTDKSNQSHE